MLATLVSLSFVHSTYITTSLKLSRRVYGGSYYKYVYWGSWKMATVPMINGTPPGWLKTPKHLPVCLASRRRLIAADVRPWIKAQDAEQLVSFEADFFIEISDSLYMPLQFRVAFVRMQYSKILNIQFVHAATVSYGICIYETMTMTIFMVFFHGMCLWMVVWLHAVHLSMSVAAEHSIQQLKIWVRNTTVGLHNLFARIRYL